MKVEMKFDLENEDDLYTYENMLNANEMKRKHDEIWDKVFRPLNKHGYHGKLQELIDKDPDLCYDVIEELIKIYQRVMED